MTSWLKRYAPLLIALGILAGCATLREDISRPVSHVLPVDPAVPLAALSNSHLAATGGASAFRLLDYAPAALAARLALVEQARRSLDIQYYIFRHDTSGKLLMDALLRAAERGVRVRLLLDDMYSGANEPVIVGLDAHKNVKVRLFNPFRVRGDNPLGRAFEYLADSERVGRRMHNKLFIADSVFGITGGRNIGDEYFQLADDVAFQDLDVLATGQVVADLGAAFDLFWNAEPAYPARGLPKSAPRRQLLDELRGEVQAVRAEAGEKLAAGLGPEVLGAARGGGWGPWVAARAEVIVDDPAKSAQAVKAVALPATQLLLRGLEVRRELVIAAPYFVPGALGVDLLHYLRNRGVEVRVLTNSLAANDVALAHVGYARYRRAMLLYGVRLHELKPLKVKPLLHTLGGGSSRASLHGKAVVFDRASAYIGSMNLDPRSVLLNTEAGLLLHGEAIAGQVAERIERAMDPEYSYRVSLDPASDGTSEALLWWETRNGAPVRHEVEPRTGALLRGLIKMLSVLPVEYEL